MLYVKIYVILSVWYYSCEGIQVKNCKGGSVVSLWQLIWSCLLYTL